MKRLISRRFAAVASAGAVARAHDDHDTNPALDRVTMIHGATGPFAIAGYRMGEWALRQLKLGRGSKDLEVVHYSPREAGWCSIVDGLQAATGASLGKLNLAMVESKAASSLVRNRKTGEEVRMELTEAFVRDHQSLPAAKAAAAGARLTAVKETEVFRVVPGSRR